MPTNECKSRNQRGHAAKTLNRHRHCAVAFTLKKSTKLRPGKTQAQELCKMHTLVSCNGPRNISYKRNESAPYLYTTSSGLTTLPRLLLILCFWVVIRASGCCNQTSLSPFFSTSAGSSLQCRQHDHWTWHWAVRNSHRCTASYRCRAYTDLSLQEKLMITSS